MIMHLLFCIEALLQSWITFLNSPLATFADRTELSLANAEVVRATPSQPHRAPSSALSPTPL